MERQIVLSHIIEQIGEIHGNRNLQKLFYLIQSLGYSLGYSFEWNTDGPVSPKLEQDIEEAISLGLIRKSFHNGIPIYSLNSKFHSDYIYSKFQTSTMPDELETQLKRIQHLLNQVGWKDLVTIASLSYLQKSKGYKLDEAKLNLLSNSGNYTNEELDFLGDILIQI